MKVETWIGQSIVCGCFGVLAARLDLASGRWHYCCCVARLFGLRHAYFLGGQSGSVREVLDEWHQYTPVE